MTDSFEKPHHLEQPWGELLWRSDLASRCAIEEIERLQKLVQSMEYALTHLQSWDMLTLNPDGTGESLHDAPWARKLISSALNGELP